MAAVIEWLYARRRALREEAPGGGPNVESDGHSRSDLHPIKQPKAKQNTV